MTSWTAGYVTDIGYTHGFYRELTPSILAMAALAKGMRGPDSGGPFAFCELGCGQGLSTNLLAAANPHGTFVATDFNPAQVAGAQRLAREAGLSNVTFRDAAFADFGEDPAIPPGGFDIIALHGIYSWISAENRQHIVRFIRRHLKVGGLVYVSYNTLPGWSVAAPLRQLMQMHARQTGGPTTARIDPALAFIERVAASNAMYFRINPTLKDRFEKIKGQNRNYLAHEYLNNDWTLLYHSQVAEEMAEAKLSYLGSAHLLDAIDAVNLTGDQQALLNSITDPTLREVTRDFLVNQQFRRDIFVKGAVPLSVPESRAAWSDLRFALSTARGDVPMKVTGSLGEANLQEDVYGPLLDGLAKGPATLRDLLATKAIADLGWARLMQGLTVLAGSSHVQPSLPVKDEGRRRASTQAFNAAVIKRAEGSADLQFLASPVTGGGVVVDRFQQLFLAARATKAPDPVAYVWNVLAAQGQRLIKDGKTLETEAENVAELSERHQTFTTQRLPTLQQLGVA